MWRGPRVYTCSRSTNVNILTMCVCVYTRNNHGSWLYNWTWSRNEKKKKSTAGNRSVCVYIQCIHARTHYIIINIVYNTKAAYTFGGHKRRSEEDGHDRSCTSIEEHDRRHSCIDLDFLVRHLLWLETCLCAITCVCVCECECVQVCLYNIRGDNIHVYIIESSKRTNQFERVKLICYNISAPRSSRITLGKSGNIAIIIIIINIYVSARPLILQPLSSPLDTFDL